MRKHLHCPWTLTCNLTGPGAWAEPSWHPRHTASWLIWKRNVLSHTIKHWQNIFCAEQMFSYVPDPDLSQDDLDLKPQPFLDILQAIRKEPSRSTFQNLSAYKKALAAMLMTCACVDYIIYNLFIIETNSYFLWWVQLIKDWLTSSESYLVSEYGRNSITKEIWIDAMRSLARSQV